MNKLISIPFLAVMLVACASTPRPPTVSFMRYMEQAYPVTQSVEVLRSKPVGRTYVELGELSVSSQDDAVLYLKEKAKQIGADAIVILGERSSGGRAVPVPMVGGYVFREDKELVVVAIKYR